jgi:hypothetical protein
MSPRARRPLALLLAALVATPHVARAGGPQAPAAQPPAAEPAGSAGSWEGWAKLTNDWPGQSCRYEGNASASSVQLALTSEAGKLRGSVAIDLPAEQGSACPPLRKRYAIEEVAAGPTTVSFTDSGGNEWTLAVRRAGLVLQGLLAWREGGPDQPLAEGFARPDGLRPLTRLSGEVRLSRADAGEPEAGGQAPAATSASEPGAAPRPKAGAGTHAKHVAIFLGANVVGLGLLYGVNKIGKGSASSGVLTCSPRVCIVGAPGAPCFCEGNVVSGSSCGSTPGAAGAPIGAPCDGTTVLCQSGLSCNSNRCEDGSGKCPY